MIEFFQNVAVANDFMRSHPELKARGIAPGNISGSIIVLFEVKTDAQLKWEELEAKVVDVQPEFTPLSPALAKRRGRPLSGQAGIANLDVPEVQVAESPIRPKRGRPRRTFPPPATR